MAALVIHHRQICCLTLRPSRPHAFPAILTQLATPIGQAYVTRSMAEFGEDAAAGMAIIGRLTGLCGHICAVWGDWAYHWDKNAQGKMTREAGAP